MWSLILIGSFLVLAIGLGAKFALDYFKSDYTITWIEFGVAAAVLLIIVVPVTSSVGTKLAFQNQVTYNESWGGFETQANWYKTTCTRDGACQHEYDCDPYTEYYTVTVDDGNGKSHTETRSRTVYHSCPYTDEEWTFTVDTTLGEYTIASHNLPTDPDSHRWRSSHGVPSGYASGIPQFWTDAKKRIDSGDPGPVTARRQYDNYILASQSTILKKYSNSIEGYKKAGLMPDLSHDVHDFYFVDRVSFEGAHPAGDWQLAANRFDGALGVDLQGDLHVIIVDAGKVQNPDDYIGAVTAYWQSDAFGKDALSKNGIVVVLGTKDGTTVAWARATTGMPVGNEAMLLDAQNQLVGAHLDPETIFGHPVASFYKNAEGKTKVKITHSNGALEKVLWGPNKFERVCMGCAGDKGVGYNYLKDQIKPTTGQNVLIILCTVFFSLIAWGICIAVGYPATRSIRSRYSDRGSWR